MVISITNVAHLFIISLNFLPLNGFNLETRLPVVKNGHNGSYFGYAVAAHQYQVEDDLSYHSYTKGLILVGAPRDQNLQPNTTQTGALWECPLTNYANDCVQVITDGRREVDSNDLYPPGEDEDKDDQWLGVTVKSQRPNGKVLVCAHRYKMVKNYEISNDNITIYGVGLCYVLKPDLEFHDALNHCTGRNILELDEAYGYCQMGTSGMIFEDDSVVLGAPGPLFWRGAIFVSSVSDDYFESDKSLYEGVESHIPIKVDEEDPKANIKKYSYMGLSVTAGYFLGNKTTVYVAGAPRNKEIGEVILYTKPQRTNQPRSVYLKEELIIKGEQIASNFGYEIIGADVNGDKLPDLIIAAPFYFTSEAGGAVYVYMNDPVSHIKNVPTIKLTGKVESRFGFALTSLGDLNKDKFEDIAIGAPYEGKGAVYIYFGSRDGLSTKPSQIIRAETDALARFPLSTFGYSLSGGVDLDENGYPDLVIGAYESDSVILLRSRPIIDIRTSVQSVSNLTNFDPNARNCLFNKTNYAPCFRFETCCTIDSIVKSKGHSVEIEYELQAETFDKQRETSRIWFDDFTKKNHTIKFRKNLTKNDNKFCYNHTAYLKENTQDIQSPIQIKMTYTLVNHDPPQTRSSDKLLPLDDYPILNQQEAVKVFKATFLKDCGNDDNCESDLIVTTNLSLKSVNNKDEYQLILGEQEKLIMNINVTNAGESAYEAQLFIFLPNRTSYSKSSDLINMKQDVCTPFESGTRIVCKLGNPMKQNERTSLQLEVDLQSVDENTSLLDFTVLANTTSEDKKRNSFKVLIVNVVDETMIHVSGDSSPGEIPELVNKDIKHESDMKYTDEIGPRVVHSYTFVNKGSWRVSDIDLEIEWPYQVANDKPQGKWLLYLDEKAEIEVSGNTRGSCKSTFINPLSLLKRNNYDDYKTANYTTSTFLAGDKDISSGKSDAPSNKISNRVKRDIEMVVTPEVYRDKVGNERKLVNMNCILNTAKCVKFSCRFDYIEKKQFIIIRIRSRLWVGTLIEDYANVDEVKIGSRAKIHIPKTMRLENIYQNEAVVETKARVKLHGQQAAAPIPLFIIIIAIIIGLLLFMLLTLLLWRLGFFKRRRPDPTLSGNLEKHRIDDSYHDY